MSWFSPSLWKWCWLWSNIFYIKVFGKQTKDKIPFFFLETLLELEISMDALVYFTKFLKQNINSFCGSDSTETTVVLLVVALALVLNNLCFCFQFHCWMWISVLSLGNLFCVLGFTSTILKGLSNSSMQFKMSANSNILNCYVIFVDVMFQFRSS